MEQKVFIPKKWFIKCVIAMVLAVLGVFLLVWIVDPYFHFHKPFHFISYRLSDERYINDGISRHFDYDTIITGTSMSQNFKTSEADELFNVQSVKESFSGAGYKELSENLDRAISRHEVKNVIWTMDFNALIRDKDYQAYEDYPTYLYDDNIFNDVLYVFNKDVLYHGVLTNIIMTLTGQESTSFDEYSSWDKETGYEHIMDSYDRWDEKVQMEPGLDEEYTQMVTENVQQNIVDLVNKYPDTTFYIFYTPYSIVWWDYMNQEGMMKWQFDAELIATKLLLECPNVKLYNFNDKYDIIENLDNYRDKEHYSADINSQILEWIADDEGLVTKDNYLERLEEEKDYYLNYDYESIFQQE
jgi:hypothetical protein